MYAHGFTIDSGHVSCPRATTPQLTGRIQCQYFSAPNKDPRAAHRVVFDNGIQNDIAHSTQSRQAPQHFVHGFELRDIPSTCPSFFNTFLHPRWRFAYAIQHSEGVFALR
ncbi:hypothetical protein AG1IA_04770 [Rhizoctonia solani AG-1 IA]|uniref:Uncharacterized protein n=1 Tax=Thanatephorus cucumeris (strain AG1-IA) TaxID=983506 RepID=L8WWQ2_THACA|nr:hypothetical protein AG1IA_04770 [Rhizoctonia solani AG-1 IA]